jgi:DNA-binding response OmpR family regulator
MQKTKGRILCVEDDEDTREMMSALLGLEGYEMVEARNIAEGLNLITSSTFDLILLDWVFDDGTGIDLCKRLRDNGTHVPVLFCSGVGNRAEIEKAMRAGAQGFLIKPVDVNDLLQNIGRFVNGEPNHHQEQGRPS